MRFPPALAPAQSSALQLDTIRRTKLTPAQRQVLLSARDRGSPTAHLSGMYDWGGWGGTRAAMQRKGLLNVACQMTDFGRRVIDYYAPPKNAALPTAKAKRGFLRASELIDLEMCPFADPGYCIDTDTPCPTCGAFGDDDSTEKKCVDKTRYAAKAKP